MKWRAGAPSGEPTSLNGSRSQPSEQPLSLSDVLAQLATQLAANNELLSTIVTQNAYLIGALTQKDEDEEAQVDLTGRPLR